MNICYTEVNRMNAIEFWEMNRIVFFAKDSKINICIRSIAEEFLIGEDPMQRLLVYNVCTNLSML